MNAAPPRKPRPRPSAARETVTNETDPRQRDPDSGELKAPTAVGKPPIAPGDTEPGAETDLPLPHERDESVGGSSAGPPDPLIEQARRDIESGQVDTDLHNPGGLNDERRRAMVEGRDPGPLPEPAPAPPPPAPPRRR